MDTHELKRTIDITMSSFNGAEVHGLVGLFFQDTIIKILDLKHNGLYRDNVIIVLNNGCKQKKKKIS